nr:glycosyltransferase [Micromonospora sp. DSM 115978]
MPGRIDRSGRAARWRLAGTPPPTHAERLSRVVGLRILRLPGTGRALVIAGSVDRLRDVTVGPAALVPIRAATFVVAWWRPSRQGWSGALSPLPWLLRHRVSRPRLPRGAATVSVLLARPAPLREIVRAVLPAFGPARPMPGPVTANVTGQDVLPAYLPAEPASSVVVGELPASADIRAHDVVLRPATGAAAPAPAEKHLAASGPAEKHRAASVPDGEHPAVSGPAGEHSRYALCVATGPHALARSRGPARVLVDARRINPRGRRSDAYRPDNPPARLEFVDPTGRRGTGWAERAGWARWTGRLVGAGPIGGSLTGPGLDAAALAALRQVGVVRCPSVPSSDPAGAAALLVQVAMTGAVVAAPDLPPQVADLIAPDLRDLLVSPVPTGDGLALEARSVRQRRAAMRDHGTAFALPGSTAEGFPELARPPSVSAVLATRRPDMLAGAVRAILGQTYPDLELILCLHGIDLPDEVRAVLAGTARPVEILRVPATASFGSALGAATRRCRGTLVTKFDDDDSYASEHVWDLVLARYYSGATLVGKGTEFVYLEHLDTTIRRLSGVPETDGDLVAGGTMLLARGDLEAVGGWRPVPRSVDYGLIDRLRRDGATIFRTHPLGYVYHRRESGHTWDPGHRYFLDAAYARWPGIPPEAFADSGPPTAAVAGEGRPGGSDQAVPAVVGPGGVA